MKKKIIAILATLLLAHVVDAKPYLICGNHNPAHTAIDSSDAAQKGRDLGCTDWHMALDASFGFIESSSLTATVDSEPRHFKLDSGVKVVDSQGKKMELMDIKAKTSITLIFSSDTKLDVIQKIIVHSSQ